MKVCNRDNTGFTKQVGAKVRAARIKAGLTQLRLAEILDMKNGALCNIERGNVSTHITTLKLIADTLGKDIKDFL